MLILIISYYVKPSEIVTVLISINCPIIIRSIKTGKQNLKVVLLYMCVRISVYYSW